MVAALLTVGWTAFFLLLIRRCGWFDLPGLGRLPVAGIFLLKVLAGLALYAVYTWYYPVRSDADIHKYFDDGNVLYAALWSEHPGDYFRMLFGITEGIPRIEEGIYREMNNWYRSYDNPVPNDSRAMIRFNAVLRLVSFGHYSVHSVFAALVGLVGLVGLYRAFAPWLPKLRGALFCAVMLAPSVVFWGSGVLKECILLCGTGLFVHGVSACARRAFGAIPVSHLLLGLVLLSSVKVYVLACLLPPAVAWVLVPEGGTARPGLRFGLISLTVGVVGLVGMQWVAGVDIPEVIRVKQQDFIGVATATMAGSAIALPPLTSSPWSFALNAPHALYVTFLAPFLAIRNGAMGMLGALENLLVPICLWAWYRYRLPWRQCPRPTVLFCAVSVLLLALVIGWTTPVIGALVRYRVPLLPLLCTGVLLCLDDRRLPAWVLDRNQR